MNMEMTLGLSGFIKRDGDEYGIRVAGVERKQGLLEMKMEFAGWAAF